MEKIVAWAKGMPRKHPAPHDQKPFYYAVCQEQGMVLVAYCCVDEQAVMVKFDNAFACMQPAVFAQCGRQ